MWSEDEGRRCGEMEIVEEEDAICLNQEIKRIMGSAFVEYD